MPGPFWRCSGSSAASTPTSGGSSVARRCVNSRGLARRTCRPTTAESDALSRDLLAPRLQVRRLDDLLRLHAGDRTRRRSHDRLLPPWRSLHAPATAPGARGAAKKEAPMMNRSRRDFLALAGVALAGGLALRKAAGWSRPDVWTDRQDECGPWPARRIDRNPARRHRPDAGLPELHHCQGSGGRQRHLDHRSLGLRGQPQGVAVAAGGPGSDRQRKAADRRLW